MYSIVSSVVMLYICFAVDTILAAENGYIVYEQPDIPCKDPSSAISACSGSLGYKIPDFSNYPNSPDISALTRKKILSAVSLFHSASEKCSKVGTKFFCEAAYPFRCKDAYVEVDGKEIAATCDEARKDCSSSGYDLILRNSFLNCSVSSYATIFGLQHKFPPKLPCGVFPVVKNDPYSCEDNYKVFSVNVTKLNLAVDRIAFAHRVLKSANISDAECEKNVADAVCKVSIPACSKDQTKVVSFLSKQDCREIMGCVNKTNDANLIQGAHGLCDNLPDGTTAKKYSLDNVYDNKAAVHAMAFSTILFIAILVAQSFF